MVCVLTLLFLFSEGCQPYRLEACKEGVDYRRIMKRRCKLFFDCVPFLKEKQSFEYESESFSKVEKYDEKGQMKFKETTRDHKKMSSSQEAESGEAPTAESTPQPQVSERLKFEGSGDYELFEDDLKSKEKEEKVDKKGKEEKVKDVDKDEEEKKEEGMDGSEKKEEEEEQKEKAKKEDEKEKKEGKEEEEDTIAKESLIKSKTNDPDVSDNTAPNKKKGGSLNIKRVRDTENAPEEERSEKEAHAHNKSDLETGGMEPFLCPDGRSCRIEYRHTAQGGVVYDNCTGLELCFLDDCHEVRKQQCVNIPQISSLSYFQKETGGELSEVVVCGPVPSPIPPPSPTPPPHPPPGPTPPPLPPGPHPAGYAVTLGLASTATFFSALGCVVLLVCWLRRRRQNQLYDVLDDALQQNPETISISSEEASRLRPIVRRLEEARRRTTQRLRAGEFLLER